MTWQPKSFCAYVCNLLLEDWSLFPIYTTNQRLQSGSFSIESGLFLCFVSQVEVLDLKTRVEGTLGPCFYMATTGRAELQLSDCRLRFVAAPPFPTCPQRSSLLLCRDETVSWSLWALSAYHIARCVVFQMSVLKNLLSPLTQYPLSHFFLETSMLYKFIDGYTIG